MAAAEALSSSEVDAIAAGCGVLAVVGRIDRGADLGPVLAALKRRPRQQGYQALTGAASLYTTRAQLGVGDRAANRELADRLATMAAEQWFAPAGGAP